MARRPPATLPQRAARWTAVAFKFPLLLPKADVEVCLLAIELGLAKCGELSHVGDQAQAWVTMWVGAGWQANLILVYDGQLVRHKFENDSCRPRLCEN
jgi:hypothetical protein